MSADAILRDRIFRESAFLSMTFSLLDSPSVSHVVLQSLTTVTHHAAMSLRMFLAKESTAPLLSLLEKHPDDLVAAELAIIVFSHTIPAVVEADEPPDQILVKAIDIPRVVRMMLAFLRKPGATHLMWGHAMTFFCAIALHFADVLRSQPSAINLLVALTRSPDLRARATGILGVLRMHLLESEDPSWTLDVLKMSSAAARKWPAHLNTIALAYGPRRLETTLTMACTVDFQKAMLRAAQTRDLAELGAYLAELVVRTEFSLPQGEFRVEDRKTGKLSTDSLGMPWIKWEDAPPFCAAALRTRGKPGDADAADIIEIKGLLKQARLDEAHALARSAISRSPQLPFFHYALALGKDFANGVRAARQGLRCSSAGPGSPGYIRHALLYRGAEHGSELALAKLHTALMSGKELEEGFAAALCALEDTSAFINEAPPDMRCGGEVASIYTLMLFLVRGHELRDGFPELRDANKRLELVDDFARFLELPIRHTQMRQTRLTIIYCMKMAQQEWGATIHAIADGAPETAATPDAAEAALAAWLERTVADDADSPSDHAHCAHAQEGMYMHPRISLNDVELYRCSWCGAPSAILRRCSGCQRTRYCDGGCQKQHWTGGHRKVCKRETKSEE
ncbi:hypothetical protein BC834DRAFT_828493 [Gloeopeniophorella convolvens]|nr:hypothetical protein BC834DRAFT_828493 [Gloeopeniophorella convolvens]